MNAYYIAYDHDGNPYIEHGIRDSRAVKYLMKIGKGLKARYFYTQKEIEAYLQNQKTDKYAREVIKQREKQGRQALKDQEKARKQTEKDQKKAEKEKEKYDRYSNEYARKTIKQREKQGKKDLRNEQFEDVSLKDYLTGGETGRRYRELEKKQREAEKSAAEAEKNQVKEQEKSKKYQDQVNKQIADVKETESWQNFQKMADRYKNDPNFDYDDSLQKWHEEQAEIYRKQSNAAINAGGTGKKQKRLQEWHLQQAEAIQKDKEEQARKKAESYQQKADKEIERKLKNGYDFWGHNAYTEAQEHQEKASEYAKESREYLELAKQYEKAAQDLIVDYERTSLPGMAQKTIREGSQALSKLLTELTDAPVEYLNTINVRVKK